MRRTWSLRSRFLLVALACLLPLLAVTAYVLFQSIAHGRDQLLDAQGATAEVVAQVLAGTLSDNERVLEAVASAEDVQGMSPDAAVTLDQFRRARPNLYGLFLYDAGGRLVAGSGMDPEALRDTPSFTGALDKALTLGEPGVSNRLVSGDSSLIAIAAPVRVEADEDGVPSGAVVSLLSVDRLKDAVLPFARGETVIAVVAGNEVIAAQGAGLEEGAIDTRLAQPIERAMSGTIGSEVYADETGERLAAYAPVPGAEWAVLVTHPSPTTYAPNRMLVERGLLALALATLATLVLVLVLGEWIARPLRRLREQAQAIVEGDYAPKPLPGGAGEISELGEAFQEMSERIATQVADLDAAREQGEAQAEQMRDLNRRTIRLQEDERRRIAGDMHDAVAPLITGALYQARAIQLQGADGDGAPDREGLDAVTDLLGRAMDELHNVIFALRPPDLDDLGVVAAIERHASGLERAGMEVDVETAGETPTLSPEVRLAIYRIVQEALHNALRHGAADHATVRFENTGEALRVSIRDNGAGFNPDVAARPTSLGLLSMRERASAIGASFAIASRPGDGTTITIERPLGQASLEDCPMPGDAAASPIEPEAAPAAPPALTVVRRESVA